MAHQLAAAHKLAMTFAGKARDLVEHDGGPYQYDGVYAVEAARVSNSSARMMDAFHKGALALHKLRTGGKQTVTVQLRQRRRSGRRYRGTQGQGHDE